MQKMHPIILQQSKSFVSLILVKCCSVFTQLNTLLKRKYILSSSFSNNVQRSCREEVFIYQSIQGKMCLSTFHIFNCYMICCVKPNVFLLCS